MLCMALFGLGLNAVHAESIEPEQAKRAVSRWLNTGRPLEKNLGKSVREVRTVNTDGTKFYVVKLEGGGFVVTSSDTQIEPIICFSPSDDLVEEEANPLWAMLTKDLPAREKALKERRKAKSLNGTENQQSEEELRWAELLVDRQLRKSNGFQPYIDFADIRVMPMVESKWGQGVNSINGTGESCYNYYTSLQCGCVATAMAQIMRYHKFPTTAVEPQTFICKGPLNSTSEKTMKGGVYDWDNMPLIPESDPKVAWYAGGATKEQREAIGKLTYDCGVAMRMSYGLFESTAYAGFAFDPLVNIFGYSSAHAYHNGRSALSADLTKKVILTNLDAGYPVLLGIVESNYNRTGHAVVGDGYGFESENNIYIHINMGYDGDQDAWYNLPNIAEYDAITDVVYNIIPDKTGEIVSGRVLDKNGRIVRNATVTASSSDGTFHEDVQVSDKGIYSFVVPSDANLVITAAYGELSNTISAQVGTSKDLTYWNFENGRYSGNTTCGNSWGNDIVLSELELEAPDELTITETVLPSGEEGIAYDAQLQLTGGSAPLHFLGPKDIYKETFAESNSFDSTRGEAIPVEGHFVDQWGGSDGYETINIPFDFPFGRKINTSLEVNTRGDIIFENGSINVLNCWGDFDTFRVESSAESLTLTWGDQRSATIYPDGKIRIAYGNVIEWADRNTQVIADGWSAVFDEKESYSDYYGANDLVIIPSGIPIGLSLDESTGRLTGKPQLAGTYNFDVTVADNDGNVLTKNMAMEVEASTNHKPVITEFGPEPTDGKVFAEAYSTTTFYVSATDNETPDGDLTYNWYLDGKWVGTGSSYDYVGTIEDINRRDHTLSCKVSDDIWEERVSVSWPIKLTATFYVNANYEPDYDLPLGTEENPYYYIPYDLSDGDIVLVAPGYYQSINFHSVKKCKVIATDGPHVTFIEYVSASGGKGKGKGDKDDKSEPNAPDNYNTIDGFTIVGVEYMESNLSGLNVKNCIINNHVNSVFLQNSILVNTVVANNAYLSFYDNKLYNCTVVNNGCEIDGNIEAHNSILWNNGSSAGTAVDQENDPMLWDAANGMFFLRPGSPCLNAGNNDEIYPGMNKDIIGNDRVQDDTVDLGAYEGVGLAAIKNLNADGNTIALEIDEIEGEQVLCATQPVALLNGADNYYRSTVDFYTPELTYTRNFPDNDFNAIYIPFSMSYSDWAQYGDMYRIDNIFTNDADDDGNPDSWALRVLKLKSNAKTEPNTPYVFKPKQAGEVTFRVENAKLSKAAELSIDCSNTQYEFEFKGTNDKFTIYPDSYFFISNNSMLQYSDQTVSLRAFRWYMGIYDKEWHELVNPSGFNPTANSDAKKIHIFSDSDYATGIHLLDAPANVSAPKVYDLSGRKLNSITKPGMYIVNGNKVFINK